jgi:hypothetical protein
MPHTPVVTVQYLSTSWNGKLINAINSRNHIRIVIKGSLASQLKGKLHFPAACLVPAPPFSAVPIPYPNVSNCLSGIPSLLSHVAIAYTTKGYTSIKASFDAHGSGKSNDELLFDLR